MVRRYSNTAVETTLSASVGSGDTAMAVADATGYPTAPFVVVVEPDTPAEEFMLVGAKSGLTFSTLSRGFDGSVDQPHNAASVVKHVAIASDFGEIWTHRHLTLEGSTSLDFAAPGNSFGGDVIEEGVEETASRSDHTHGRPSLSAGGGMGYVSVHRTVEAILASGEVIPWTVDDLDTDAFHDPGVNPSRFTIPVGLGGLYLIMVGCTINLAAAGDEANLSIRKNGSLQILEGVTHSGNDVEAITLTGPVPLVEGDYVECLIFHDVGFATPVGRSGSRMSMIRLGA